MIILIFSSVKINEINYVAKDNTTGVKSLFKFWKQKAFFETTLDENIYTLALIKLNHALGLATHINHHMKICSLLMK